MCVSPVEANSGNLGRGCCSVCNATKNWLAGKNPNFKSLGCFGIRKISGSSNYSVHSTGRAIDISCNAYNATQRDSMWAALNQMLSARCAIQLQRIIFDRRIWSANEGYKVGPNGFRNYSGTSNPHTDHAHIEFAPGGCNVTYEQFVAAVNGSGNGTDGTGGGAPVIIPPLWKPDPIDPPIVTTITIPPPQPPLPLTDTSGKWNTITLANSCDPDGLIPEERRSMFFICGGRGAYLVDNLTGQLCAAGLAMDYGDIPSGGFKEFLPYGGGYYVLGRDGRTIMNYGPGTGTDRPSCALAKGPFDGLYSPRSGVVVATVDPGTGPTLSCSFTAPETTGIGSGPCC